jgi:maltooligosyltrehalose trehalohydrolase
MGVTDEEAGWSPAQGAATADGTVRFRVWAPNCDRIELVLAWGSQEEPVRMESRKGFHTATVDSSGTPTYEFVLDGKKRRPDPASLHQPEGVHAPSRVVDPGRFPWHDSGWQGIPLEDLLLYEIHVGTFTGEGTFDSAARALEDVKALGVNAVEIMPIAQFPGKRNWGYDGVYPYAPQESYGGPEGFARLVDRCHAMGMAVVLDVVYNHLGQEGNYLADFGPYFSNRYRTPWGGAFNYDDVGSDQVRRFVIDNALHWVRNYHVDGLRLDAAHSIFDSSPKHILQELTEEVKTAAAQLGKEVNVIAESDLNDPRLVRRTEECGFGLDAQWADDMHHSMHALITGERFGYYQDFGSIVDLGKALREPFVYDGRYSAYRGRSHGSVPAGIPGRRFVVCAQNHDQVGNRADGARLAAISGVEAAKVAAALVILSPYTPLLFMGEEYGETAPFYFFVDYGDPKIIESTRRGRKKELEGQKKRFVDPQAPETFEACRLNRSLSGSGGHKDLVRYYSRLIAFRAGHPAIRADRLNSEVRVFADQGAIAARRWSENEELLLLFVLQDAPARLGEELEQGRWSLALSSRDGVPTVLGTPSAPELPAFSAAVYKKGL